MKHEIETQWMGRMQFNALVNGHTITMDAPERVGGDDLGPIPKPFILTALSGCTGMDVVALLRKQDIELKNLNLKVSGELSKQAPVEYVAAHIIYEIDGDEIDRDAVFKAVMDSQEKLCGVSHMLKKIMPVSWEIIFNGNSIFNNTSISQPLISKN